MDEYKGFKGSRILPIKVGIRLRRDRSSKILLNKKELSIIVREAEDSERTKKATGNIERILRGFIELLNL